MADGQGKPNKRGCGQWALIGAGVFVGLGVLGTLIGDPESLPSDPVEQVKMETALLDWRREVEAQRVFCNLRAGVLGERMTAFGKGNGSAVDGFRAAQDMENGCGSVWMQLDDIPVPDADSATESKIDDAIEVCKTEVWLKKEAGEKAAQFFDGDARPSVMVGMEQDLSDAAGYASSCDAALDNVVVLPADAATPE
ncbi:hypothetical protein ACRAQ6_14095 [Erythrobacter sp. HA6-11]